MLYDKNETINQIPAYIPIYEFYERAGIIEYDGKETREKAELLTLLELKEKYNF